MKCVKTAAFLLGALCALPGHAQSDDDMPLSRNYPAQRALYDELGVGFFEMVSLLSHPAIRNNLWSGSLGEHVPAFTPPPPGPVSLSEYETPLPHKTQRMITRLEKMVLTAYLDKPNDKVLAKFLALYHLNAMRPRHGKSAGSVVEHTIMAEYFLNRARELGAKDRWISAGLRKTQGKLASLANRPGVFHEETHEAHLVFHDAMFYHEENRYIAYQKLLDDYAAHPNNVYTAFLNTAVNLWTGGEAGYDDPTVLYNFVLGSYFSLRAIDLAKRAEAEWQADPVNKKRFRTASILGGFSVSQRRFLAKLVNDTAALETLDDEHRAWWPINPLFHMFTIGYTWFEDPQNFEEAFDFWEEGFMLAGRPDAITNQNRPRYTFNQQSMFMGSIDFNLKIGDLDAIRQFWAPTVPFLPYSDYWVFGWAPLEHRMANLEAISALYRNDDPKDDPVPFNAKRRKWGYNTMTCQTCHQTQNMAWSEEEKNNVLIAPDDILTVSDWPAISTTWYGSSKQ